MHTDTVPWRRVYNVRQAADRLDLSETLVRRLLHTKQLHAVRAGRRWLISETAISRFLDSGVDATAAHDCR